MFGIFWHPVRFLSLFSRICLTGRFGKLLSSSSRKLCSLSSLLLAGRINFTFPADQLRITNLSFLTKKSNVISPGLVKPWSSSWVNTKSDRTSFRGYRKLWGRCLVGDMIGHIKFSASLIYEQFFISLPKLYLKILINFIISVIYTFSGNNFHEFKTILRRWHDGWTEGGLFH